MNIEMLVEGFKEILAYEERAKHFYDHYIDQIDDRAIRDQLAAIRNEEIMHIKIAKELIECVS